MPVETSAFFAVTGLAFWGLLLLETIILLICIEYEAGIRSVLSLILVGLIFKWYGSFDIFSWAYNNLRLFAEYVVCYFTIGAGYCVLKWWSWAKNKREEYEERKNLFLKSHAVHDGKVPQSLKLEWEKDCRIKIDGEEQVINSEWKIYMWIAYWPWSGLWTLINDPIKRILKWIYRLIKGLLKNIYDRQFADVKSDFLTVEERQEEHKRAKEIEIYWNGEDYVEKRKIQ